MRQTQVVGGLGSQGLFMRLLWSSTASCATRAGIARLSVGLLLLTPHAVRARRGEEAAAALLASAVPSVFAANCAAEAIGQTSEEQACGGGPHEGESLDAQARSLAVAAEGVAALDKDSAGYIVSSRSL